VDTLKRPTAKDAEIYLRLLETMNTPEMQKASEWFMEEFSAKDYEEFKSKYRPESEGFRHVGQILASLEIAGTLVSHGLLNENLYFDTSGIEFIWKKVESIVPGWQKEAGPALWENAVWLAERQKQWKKEVWKPSLAWKLKPRGSGTSRKSR